MAAPEWVFPLLKANFRTSRTSNSDVNNYGFFCTTCMGCAIREIDKRDHPGHEILRALKASHHYAVCASDVVDRLNCQDIAKFTVNDKRIFFINSRAKPRSKESGSSKGACIVCAWRLPEPYATCAYCSLACKFKKNDDTGEEVPMEDGDQPANSEKAKHVKEESNEDMKCSIKKRRGRKGIPNRAPLTGSIYIY